MSTTPHQTTRAKRALPKDFDKVARILQEPEITYSATADPRSQASRPPSVRHD
ncbi:unnamed protein product [Tuber melanosporum]|uniref:(Perigord truffle) hypothetical protein n=1 Tax=Tuber melanosporum (strain Mel28) TaxID=656061 RepID=D5GQ18_TUBMM|nr:uncharacterized protein GSTUM_00012150001 [Tuber melanosporum]CAZ86611.1 unnamed protein product [Tuber melanosporum]